jgi:hypothetical protein
MSEIKPKYVDGEPVCSDGCPKYIQVSDMCGLRPLIAADIVHGDPCIPALRRDRDQLKLSLWQAKSDLDVADLAIRTEQHTVYNLENDIERLTEQLDQAIKERDEARSIALDLSDEDPCHYDYNYYCQTHYHKMPCPVGTVHSMDWSYLFESEEK